MGRIRTIKPEFPQSESIGRVSRDARLLFIMLWTMVDDEGRARAAPRMLASLLYPYDDDAKRHIAQWLSELEREGCIRLYEHDGNAYLQIEKWLEHQKIDKPSKSRLPPPSDKPLEHSPKPREDSTADLGPRTSTKDKDMPADAGLDGFEEFWSAYRAPPNSKKPEARQAWQITAKTRPPQSQLLIAVTAYNAWLADQWRKNKREFPAKQHASTWLRGEVWGGFVGAEQGHYTAEELEAMQDRRDRLMKQGRYDPMREAAQ